jgi:hypothetical protein
MKIRCGLAMILIAGSTVHADSLGEAAKREEERREKAKHASPAPEPKVIHIEDLGAPSGKDGKGTFNPAAGSAKGADGTSGGAATVRSSGSASAGGSGDNTEVDRKRIAARRQLEASYAAIAAAASSLEQIGRDYDGRGCEQAKTTPTCARLLKTGVTYALSIAVAMDRAEEAARMGWLSPGEVRATRERYNMTASYWDRLVSLVSRYLH